MYHGYQNRERVIYLLNANDIKVAGATIAGIVSWVVGGLGMALTVLICLMILDYATGLMVGWSNGELSSSVGKKGLLKKVYILILIFAMYLMKLTGLDLAGYTADGLAVAYSILEVLSIIENGGKLGVPIPDKLKAAIAALKD